MLKEGRGEKNKRSELAEGSELFLTKQNKRGTSATADENICFQYPSELACNVPGAILKLYFHDCRAVGGCKAGVQTPESTWNSEVLGLC